MNEESDGQLLKAFAATRDEGAFRLLTRRHLGLIFHTAMRRTGNRPLTEEISQNILLAMSRKAAVLARDPKRLPAWLHRATLYETNKAMRTESSYQWRKQLISAEPEDAGRQEDAALWQAAVPHLDLAIDKLPEADRKVILLHYFEDHPFPRIAERLGKSVVAVQKQSQRALEKLSRSLRSQGVTLSVGALGGALGTQTAKAVSEAFLRTSADLALSSVATPSAFSLTAMIASKPKFFIPLALLLLATPLVLQQFAIAGERTHLRALLDENQPARANAALELDPPRAARFRSPEISSSLDVMVLAKEQATATRLGGVVLRDFQAKLAGMDPQVLADLIRKTSVAPLGTMDKSGLSSSLVAALAATNPKLALTTAIAVLDPREAMRLGSGDSPLSPHLAQWMRDDPAAALAWFQDQEKSAKFNGPALLKPPGSVTLLDDLRGAALTALLTSGAPQAGELLRTAPPEERASAILNSIDSLQKGASGEWLGNYLQVMRGGLVPEDKRGEIFAKLAQAAGRDGLLRLGDTGAATPKEREALVRARIQGEVMQADGEWEASNGQSPPLDMEAMTAWLHEVAPGQEDQILRDAEAAGEQQRQERIDGELARLQSDTTLSERSLAKALCDTDLSGRFQEGLALAERIQDPELKKKVVDYLTARRQPPASK